MTRARSLGALALFLVLALGVAALGGSLTAAGMPDWYASLRKPSFNPPSWVFGPVWTTLYVLMAVAAWLVWKRAGLAGARLALTAWLVQLALNLAWSGLFFALRSPAVAFVDLVALWVMILVTMLLFFRHSRAAGWLMAPYLAWVTFAGALNLAIVLMN